MRGIALVILFYFLQSVAANILYEIEQNLAALKNEHPSFVKTSDEIHKNEWGQKVEEIRTIKQFNKINHHAEPNTVRVITIDIDRFGNEVIVEKEIHVLDANKVAKAETSSSLASSSAPANVSSGDFASATNTAATSTSVCGYRPSPHGKDDPKSAAIAETVAAAAASGASDGGYRASSSSASSSSSAATRVGSIDFGSATNAAATGGASGDGCRPSSHGKDGSKSAASAATAAAAAASGASGGGYRSSHSGFESPARSATQSVAAAREVTAINIEVDELGNELISEEKIYVNNVNKVDNARASSSSASSSSSADTRVASTDFGSATNAATTGGASVGRCRPNSHEKDGSKSAGSVATAAAAATSGASGGGYRPSPSGFELPAESATQAVAATREVTAIKIEVDGFGNELISEEKIYVNNVNKVDNARASSSSASSSSSAATRVGSTDFGSATNAAATGGASGAGYRLSPHGKDGSKSASSEATALATVPKGVRGGGYGPTAYRKDNSGSPVSASEVDKFGNEIITEEKFHVKDISKVDMAKAASSMVSSSSAATGVGSSKFGSAANAATTSGASGGGYRPNPHDNDRSRPAPYTAVAAAAVASGASYGGYGSSLHGKDSSGSTANAATAAAASEVTVINLKVDEFGNELISEEKFLVKDTNKVGNATLTSVSSSTSSLLSAPTKVGYNNFGLTTNAAVTSGVAVDEYQPSLHGKDGSRSTTSTTPTAAATVKGASGGGYRPTSYEKDSSRSAASVVTPATIAAGDIKVTNTDVGAFGNKLISEEKINVKNAKNNIINPTTSSLSVSSSASSSLPQATRVDSSGFGSASNAATTGGESSGGYQPSPFRKDGSRSAANAAAGGASGGRYEPSAYGQGGDGSAVNTGAATAIAVTGDDTRGRYGQNHNRQNGFGSAASELRPGSTYNKYAEYKPAVDYEQLNKYGRGSSATDTTSTSRNGATASIPGSSASQYQAKEQPGAKSSMSLASAETATTSTEKNRPTEITFQDVEGSLTTPSTSTSSPTSISGVHGDDKGVDGSSSTSTAESSAQNDGGLHMFYGVRASKNCRLFRKQLSVKIGTRRQPCFTC